MKDNKKTHTMTLATLYYVTYVAPGYFFTPNSKSYYILSKFEFNQVNSPEKIIVFLINF
jgi:hypothetical protein